MDKKNTNKKTKKSKFVRILQEIGKSIVDSFKNFAKNFKKSSKEFKIILGIWIIVVIVVLVVLFSVKFNRSNKIKHEKIENEVKVAALAYVKDKKLDATANQKLRLNMEIFIDDGYLYKESITDNTCNGYVLVYYDEYKDNYEIEPYISCKNYVTDGYEVR
jgi:hypothetical protein